MQPATALTVLGTEALVLTEALTSADGLTIYLCEFQSNLEELDDPEVTKEPNHKDRSTSIDIYVF